MLNTRNVQADAIGKNNKTLNDHLQMTLNIEMHYSSDLR